MSDAPKSFLQSAVHRTRYPVSVGIALVSILPVLFFYLISSDFFSSHSEAEGWQWAALLLIALIAVGGYALLRHLPVDVSRLRRSLESMVRGQYPEKAGLVRQQADDLAAIENCMNLIVEELKQKVNAAESEKERLQHHLLLAKKMESLSTMAAGLAHDFNNLLASILGNASIILRSLPEESSVKSSARQIEITALRAVTLTNEIFVFSGRGNLVTETVNISSLIHGMTDRLTDGITGNIEIQYQLCENMPLIEACPSQMEQVVANLVENAAEAMMDKAGTITLATGVLHCEESFLQTTYTFEKLSPGKYAFIQVTDMGCGIRGKIWERMFDPFFSTKIRGHGMGLSIAMGIVRAHGGAMKAETTPGQGSSFMAIFPCQPCADTAIGQANP